MGIHVSNTQAVKQEGSPVQGQTEGLHLKKKKKEKEKQKRKKEKDVVM